MLIKLRKKLFAAAIASAAGGAAGAPMTLQDYLALQGPQPAQHIAYGDAPSQFVELFLAQEPQKKDGREDVAQVPRHLEI